MNAPDPRRVTENRLPTGPATSFGHELFPDALPGVRFFNEKAVRARAGLLLIIGLVLLVIRIDHGNHQQFVLPADYAEEHGLEGHLFSPMPTVAPTTTTEYVCPMHADDRAEEPGVCTQCGMDLVAEVDAEVLPAVVPRVYDHSLAIGLLWYVIYEMLAAFLFGMTLSPLGWLGTLLTWNQVPEWTEARPKRLAWLIGVVFACVCQLALTTGILMSIALYTLFACVLFMFLEAAVGFCFGCWVYGFFPARGGAAPAE